MTEFFWFDASGDLNECFQRVFLKKVPRKLLVGRFRPWIDVPWALTKIHRISFCMLKNIHSQNVFRYTLLKYLLQGWDIEGVWLNFFKKTNDLEYPEN